MRPFAFYHEGPDGTITLGIFKTRSRAEEYERESQENTGLVGRAQITCFMKDVPEQASYWSAYVLAETRGLKTYTACFHTTREGAESCNCLQDEGVVQSGVLELDLVE
jgi:hypothetical protein